MPVQHELALPGVELDLLAGMTLSVRPSDQLEVAPREQVVRLGGLSLLVPMHRFLCVLLEVLWPLAKLGWELTQIRTQELGELTGEVNFAEEQMPALLAVPGEKGALSVRYHVESQGQMGLIRSILCGSGPMVADPTGDQAQQEMPQGVSDAQSMTPGLQSHDCLLGEGGGLLFSRVPMADPDHHVQGGDCPNLLADRIDLVARYHVRGLCPGLGRVYLAHDLDLVNGRQRRVGGLGPHLDLAHDQAPGQVSGQASGQVNVQVDDRVNGRVNDQVNDPVVGQVICQVNGRGSCPVHDLAMHREIDSVVETSHDHRGKEGVLGLGHLPSHHVHVHASSLHHGG